MSARLTSKRTKQVLMTYVRGLQRDALAGNLRATRALGALALIVNQEAPHAA